MKSIFSNLTFQVLVAISLGVAVGALFPGFAPNAKLISQSFINMISMLIAPIIFFTIVLGIAHMGDMKKLVELVEKHCYISNSLLHWPSL